MVMYKTRRVSDPKKLKKFPKINKNIDITDNYMLNFSTVNFNFQHMWELQQNTCSPAVDREVVMVDVEDGPWPEPMDLDKPPKRQIGVKSLFRLDIMSMHFSFFKKMRIRTFTKVTLFEKLLGNRAVEKRELEKACQELVLGLARLEICEEGIEMDVC